MFAHNGSNFDFFFIIEAITSNPKYSIYDNANQCIFKGSRIISLWFCGHKFIDTMNFMAGSLDSLCESFKIKNKKIKDFMIGDKHMTSMDICLYENKSLTPQQYIDYLKANPEMMEAYIKYCEFDCKSLEEIHSKFTTEMKNIVEIIHQEKGIPVNPKLDINSASTLPGFIFKVWNNVEVNEYVPEGAERVLK